MQSLANSITPGQSPIPGGVVNNSRAVTITAPIQVFAATGQSPNDIAGAVRAGIDSLFILGGIHAAELMRGNSLDLPAFADLCRREGATPRYLSGEFCW